MVLYILLHLNKFIINKPMLLQNFIAINLSESAQLQSNCINQFMMLQTNIQYPKIDEHKYVHMHMVPCFS